MANNGAGMPMSQDATLNLVDRLDPGANRSRSVPASHASQLLSPFADSFSAADAHHLTGRPRSASSQLASDLATSWGPSPTIPTLCPLPSNPSSTDPEPLLSRSIKRPSHEPNDSTDYNFEIQDHPEGVADGERDTNARLTSRYVDPEDHPAYKELQTRIHQSHNDQDRWKACMIFHERYKDLKEPLGKLGEEIEEKRRQLEEAEASRGDKESNLDALVLLGTSFMRLKCERFGQVQQSYNEARHKRPRSSDYPKQPELQASGQEWSDFFDNHTKASRDLQKCEKVLECIGKTWGDDKIRYYGWATKTWTTCRVLQSAVKVVPTWEEAGIKLNRLRNYRDRSMGTPITHGKRSISWKDLDNLRLWKGCGEFEMPSPPVRKKRTEDSGEDRVLRYAPLAMGEFNAERLGFDKFGILVLKESKLDDEGPMTSSAPPWGMAKSADIGQEAEEQMGDTKSLLGDQGEGSRNDVQDEPTPITSIRGSARLAAHQPQSYTKQCAPLKKPVSHRTKLRPDTDIHVVGDDEYGLDLPANENRRQWLKSAMVDATTQTDPMLGGEIDLTKARDLSSSSQGAELGRYCTDFQDREKFKRQAVEELNEVGDKSCWGAESSRSCSHYLSRSYRPAITPGNGQPDAYFSTLDEAKGLVDRMTPDVPIFTRCSNAGGWKPNLRPIVDYLTRIKTVQTKKRYVQKYSLEMTGESFTKVTQWELMCHFLGEDGADGLDLWNALELENHLEQRHVPEFLTNANCSLLVEMRKRAEEKRVVKKGRKGKNVAELPEKDPLHFALIADGGMNTYPHTDSHGYSTFLTVQEGELIFGWLSRPDDHTWNEWARNPRYFGGGRWCFVVMKPGDSAYLPSGTPHYVVRRKGAQTFILGGHVLQWSNLHGWASLLRRQIENPTTTNEHMASETVRRYVEVARDLVGEAMKSGDDRLEYLGGIEAAKQTLLILEDLQEMIENKQT